MGLHMSQTDDDHPVHRPKCWVGQTQVTWHKGKPSWPTRPDQLRCQYHYQSSQLRSCHPRILSRQSGWGWSWDPHPPTQPHLPQKPSWREFSNSLPTVGAKNELRWRHYRNLSTDWAPIWIWGQFYCLCFGEFIKFGLTTLFVQQNTITEGDNKAKPSFLALVFFVINQELPATYIWWWRLQISYPPRQPITKTVWRLSVLIILIEGNLIIACLN